MCSSRQAQTRPYNKKCFNCGKTRHFLHDCQLPPTEETKKKCAEKAEKAKTVNNKSLVNSIQVVNSAESLSIKPSVFIENISDNVLMTEQSFKQFLNAYNVSHKNKETKHCIDILDSGTSIHMTLYLFCLQNI